MMVDACMLYSFIFLWKFYKYKLNVIKVGNSTEVAGATRIGHVASRQAADFHRLDSDIPWWAGPNPCLMMDFIPSLS